MFWLNLFNAELSLKRHWRGPRSQEVGQGRQYPTLRCHHQNCSCSKTCSDESRFNVSLIVRDKVTRQCPQTTTFKEKGQPEAESNRGPSAYQPNALPLGQTGSQAVESQSVGYNAHPGGIIIGCIRATPECEPVWPSGKALGW